MAVPRIIAFLEPLRDTPKFYAVATRVLEEYCREECFSFSNTVIHDDPQQFSDYLTVELEDAVEGILSAEEGQAFYHAFVGLCRDNGIELSM